MAKPWIDETVRDLIALGGLPFFFLTVVRVSLLGRPDYPLRFVVGALLFFLLKKFLAAQTHAGLGTLLFILISLYYADPVFTFFALIVYVVFVAALFYQIKKKQEVANGIYLGVIGAVIACFAVQRIFP